MKEESRRGDKFVEVYNRSDVIFEEGSGGNEMYIVSSGKVRLYSGQGTRRRNALATLGPGEHFGEMALVDTSPRSATAVAVQNDTRLVVLDRPKFLYLVQQQPEFTFTIMETLCRRIREANEQIDLAKRSQNV